ncbi:AraC-like DNA-binding protein [Chitinophaga niastensis]|uniref:AraC-like DNA-binding protein n=1 Tax=Chitinophaga niastensis TaxID=536980 RepID=A0A2P8HNW9_CHINA|nr:AraC family transcriptional regulator [Chitinophaga niastensis]PSL47901.1 AraC-like DNA-binding protein [Chitinophaga niastensis]
MNYQTTLPPKHLAHIIRFFWELQSDSAYTHFGMADACAEMLFHYQGAFDEMLPNGKTEKSFSSGIQGVTEVRRKYVVDTGFGIFGVYFYPHAVPLLFGMPATELKDVAIDLKTVLKADGADLEEKIMLAKDNAERIAIICRFTETRLAANYTIDLPVFAAVKHIIHKNPETSIKALAQQYYLSERQFERQFKHYTGLNPKIFTRIVRFQAAIAYYNQPVKNLGTIALNCGYYDQAHFINEFKALSGMHPKQYFSGLCGATNWMD